MSFIEINNLTKKHTNRRGTRRSPADVAEPGEMITVLDDINLEFDNSESKILWNKSNNL